MSFEYEVNFWFEYIDDERHVGHSDQYVFRSPQKASAKCGRLQNRENLKDKKIISIGVDKIECCDNCGEWIRRWNDYEEFTLVGEEPECLENSYRACTCRVGKLYSITN